MKQTKYIIPMSAVFVLLTTGASECKQAETSSGGEELSIASATINAPSTTLRSDLGMGDAFEASVSTLEAAGVSSGLPIKIIGYTILNARGKLIDPAAIDEVQDNTGAVESLNVDFGKLGVGIYKVALKVQNSAGVERTIQYRVYQNDTVAGATTTAAARAWVPNNDGNVLILLLDDMIAAGFAAKSDISLEVTAAYDAKGGKADFNSFCGVKSKDKAGNITYMYCKMAEVYSGTLTVKDGKSSKSVNFITEAAKAAESRVASLAAPYRALDAKAAESEALAARALKK